VQSSGQKPRFLPAPDEVKSAQSAAGAFEPNKKEQADLRRLPKLLLLRES
jgi:hypothetical protein